LLVVRRTFGFLISLHHLFLKTSLTCYLPPSLPPSLFLWSLCSLIMLTRALPKVHFIRGDIMNKDHLLNACFGRDVVFHTSGKPVLFPLLALLAEARFVSCHTALVNYWSRLKHDADKINQINYGGTKVSSCCC